MSDAPLLACVHHPAVPDLDLVRGWIREAARPVDLRALPLRESVKLRRARQAPPVSEALLAEAPAPDLRTLEAWADAEVICTLDLPPEWLDRMPKLRFVQAYSAGLEQFPLERLAARGCLLYTSPSPRDLSTSRMPSSA